MSQSQLFPSGRICPWRTAREDSLKRKYAPSSNHQRQKKGPSWANRLRYKHPQSSKNPRPNETGRRLAGYAHQIDNKRWDGERRDRGELDPQDQPRDGEPRSRRCSRIRSCMKTSWNRPSFQQGSLDMRAITLQQTRRKEV
jgi:hypothetical protein